MDYKKEIGKRIKTAREALDWSQERLSKETDGILGKSRIGNYEQGTRMPRPKEIKILARVLGVGPSYLMCLDEDEDMNKEESDLLRNYRRLPEKDRLDYHRRIEALAMIYRDPVPDEITKQHIKPAPELPPEPPPKPRRKIRRATR